jgi:thioredoxin reductase
VVFADGSSDERAGLFFMPRTTVSPLLAELGCEVDRSGRVIIDADGRTSIPGVFAAGDTTTDRRAVVLAAAAGSRAAYVINGGLARATRRTRAPIVAPE